MINRDGSIRYASPSSLSITGHVPARLIGGNVCDYIHLENVPIVPLYFAKPRPMVVRGETLIPVEHNMPLLPGEKPRMVMCRMRSLGCTYCTGAIRSEADTLPKIIEEMIQFRRSERENRVIDHDQEGSMELKKREGYF